MSDLAIKIDHVSKEYRLGAIGGTTLREEFHRLADRFFHRESTSSDFGKKFMALQDINLEVKKGERLAIIGHNGAGKSTLLKLLARVTGPTTGTIAYNGRISSMLEVGTGFHGELTGRENIYMNGAILGMSKREIDSKIDQIIEFAEMEKFIDTPVKRYSSGMYVKLAFAVAAHLDNEILIMDEVLAVGDMKFQQKCLGKMGEASIQEGKTVLYVSHNLNTIINLCNRCVVLDHGRIIHDGDIDKAICLYMGLLNRTPNPLILTEDMHQKRGDVRIFEIQSVYIRNYNRGVFLQNSSIEFELSVFATKQLKNIWFRFEICFADGSIIGTSISESKVDFKNGNSTVLFQLPLSGLVPGRYQSKIVAFVTNEYGNQYWIDNIPKGLVFEITDSEHELDRLKWSHQHWGHVKFNPTQIKLK